MTTPLKLPPRSCPMCLVGACHRCTGLMTVLNAAERAREVPCEHIHRAGQAAAERVIADIPILGRSAAR